MRQKVRLPGWRTSPDLAVRIAQLRAAGVSVPALATRYGHTTGWVRHQLAAATLAANSSTREQTT
jgi:hypothetical protein